MTAMEPVDVQPSQNFEEYRYNAPRPITLPRLFFGTLLIVICWFGTTALLLLPAMGLISTDLGDLMTSGAALFPMLLSFGGIWIGVWLAQRFIHGDRLGNVLGATGRLAWSDFGKGFAAIVLTSLLSEVLIYLIRPEFARSSLPLSTWFAALIPVAILCFVQTSAEEVLFRGYFTRGLANRFRSPWIWGLLPALCFVLIHYTPDMTAKDAAIALLSIGALTVVLVLLVYITGNLGAAMGLHMGNNLMSFVLVGHQEELSHFALFKGAPVGDGTMSGGQTVALVLTGWLCVWLTWWLVTSSRSPLRVNFK